MTNWQMALLALALAMTGSMPSAAQVTRSQMTTPQATDTTQEARIPPDSKCWSDWSEAAVIVRRETLMPVERVSRLASAKHPGATIIKVTLCEEQSRFVYRLLLRDRQGQLKSELLDARQAAGQ
jgi:uncharacterized membrane protein YkoI